jgi:DNA-directed RNA polymerase specialized sigma24 family protein
VYKHLRLKWKQDPEQARDTTQGFFARAFEKRYFADYEPARARFRTYLRTCLDRFVMENRRGELRQKRGGQLLHLSLDFEPAEAELGMLESSSQTDPEARFDAEWTRSLLGAALAELSQQCGAQGKQLQLKVFKRYVLDNELGATGADEATRRRDVSYAAIAEELGLKVSDVTNHLAWARRELRRILLDKLAELAPSEEELESEARALFGATP